MQSTEKFLSIKNFKKYFPVAKSSVFSREQLYLKANENISIDICRGETLGIVGESGCGKSTFGRTLLRLYEETGGSVTYYGRARDELAPHYVEYTLKNHKRLIREYEQKQKIADILIAECEKAGKDSDELLIQRKNLAVSVSDTALHRIAELLGGFMTLDDPSPAVSLLLKKHHITAEIARIRRRYGDDLPSLDDLNTALSDVEKKISNLKSKYSENEKFNTFEKYLDCGIDLTRLTNKEMRLLRRDLQIIFQDPYSSLNPRMTVGQIIQEGLVAHRLYKRNSPKTREYILKIMRECGLQDYMINRYPHEFSGGQRQRISIARSLALNPKFVVCDECVSALDVSIQSQILNLLDMLKKKQNLTYLFISHDLSVVRYVSDRIGVMYLGSIVEIGDSEEVFKDPRHPYTVALLSAVPSIEEDGAYRKKIILEGSIPSPIRPPKGCKFHTRCYMACDKCKKINPPLAEIEPGHMVACHFPEKKINENGDFLFTHFKHSRKEDK